jgi:replicative DNA helicase Mcm
MSIINDGDILKGVSNVTEESTDTLEQEKVKTVSETIRLHNEDVNVRGLIVGVSELIKMISARTLICNTCNTKLETETYDRPLFIDSRKNTRTCQMCKNGLTIRYDYVNAVKVKLQDDEPDGQLEQLTCLLFGADTLNIRPGEMVEVKGRVEVDRHKDALYPLLYAQSIKYERKQEPEVASRDIESFKRFAKTPNVIHRLVSMFAPKVIGHNAEKLGILRSLVGSPEGNIRGRIHTILIGPPGVAKTMLSREGVDVKPGSRYVTAQNASGKGITAIIDKENDTTFLRLGAVPQARGAVCCINEIGRMDYENQGFLLDVMEEGSFTVDKYAIHVEIKSATTIIATANPTGMRWDDPLKISNTEIPVLGTLLDRFDQIYAVNDFTSEEECREYAAKKAEMNERSNRYNYNFIKLYIKYAHTINPTISPEAQFMLTEFWLDLKKKELATNRTLNSLFRIAKSQARLHLSSVVNEEIVTEIMEDCMQRMLQYGQIIKIIESPRDVTYREMLSIIKATKSPIELIEAARMACQRNEQIRNYLGNRLDIKNNWKLRTVRDMLLDNRSIKQVNDKPIILLWSEGILSDVSDVCDDGNGKETMTSNVRSIPGDVSEVCDDGNGKTLSSQQWRESEEEVGKKVDLSKDILNRDLGDNSKDGMDGSPDALSVPNNVPNGLHKKDMEGNAREGVNEVPISGRENNDNPVAANTNFSCYHCDESFVSDLERVKHIMDEHPGKLCYPTPEDFDNRFKPNKR